MNFAFPRTQKISVFCVKICFICVRKIRFNQRQFVVEKSFFVPALFALYSANFALNL